MSNIQFHTLHGEPLTVSGSERAHAANTAVEATLHALGADLSGGLLALRLSDILPGEALAFTAFGKSPRDALHMWLSDPMGMSEVTINGESSPVIAATLNTAAVAGPNPVAFLARLHGSVENRMG